MIRIRLRECMKTYELRTGERLTYAGLTELSGVAVGTLSSMGSRVGYNVTIDTIEKICRALDVNLGDLLEIIPDPPKPKRKGKKKKTKKKA